VERSVPYKNVFIGATSLKLGQRVPVAQALASGCITPARAAALGQLAVRIDRHGRHGTDLVADAAHEAIYHSGLLHRALEIGPVYYAPMSAGAQLDAAMLCERLLLPNADRRPAVTKANGDQGVIDAIAAAALHLDQPDTDATNALVTAGGAWPVDPSDRWGAPMPLGDGTGAIVLTTYRGPLRLLATATRVDDSLAELRRNDGAPEEISKSLVAALTDVGGEVLRDADVDPKYVRFLVSPFGSDRPEHVAGRALANIRQGQLNLQIQRGRNFGRLGTAELIVGLHALNRGTSATHSSDYILLLAHSGDDSDSVGAALVEVE
jgi:hypothetical protein